jgi:hypothetical protein
MVTDEVKTERIVRDIVNHHIEGAESITDTEIMEFERDVRSMSLEDLEDMWVGTVGEWILPMERWSWDEYYVEVENEDGESEEVPVWEDEGYDNVADWQFDKLVETGDTDYGYREYSFEQPYLPRE